MAEEIEKYAVWTRCDNCKVLGTAEVVRGETTDQTLKELTCEHCGCSGRSCVGFIGKVATWKTYLAPV